MNNEIKKAIRSSVEDGAFGDVRFMTVEEDYTNWEHQYCSSLIFCKLTVEDEAGEHMLHLVIKLAPGPEMIRYFDTQAQFHNETTMYKEALLALGADPDSYPKLYYENINVCEQIERYVIVLDNLHYKGFTGRTENIFLDFDHISKAIKKLAQFHSLSYTLKQENMPKFIELTKKFRKPKDGFLAWSNGNYDHRNLVGTIFIERAMKGFIKTSGKDDKIFVKFLEKLRDPREARSKLSSAEEPFGVLCHGDFTNYNILLKQNDRDIISDVAMVDFQLSCYGSVAMDLSLFLFLHTHVDMRRKHLDEFLETYYVTLRNNVGNNVKIPNFVDFLNHFAKRATFGFMVSCLYVPMLMDMALKSDKDIWWKKSMEEAIEWAKSVGGEGADKFLAGSFSHFYTKGYLNTFMEYAEEINL